eukprot:scaffold29905_cov64-Phaeocystis_antarctica.AAC.7
MGQANGLLGVVPLRQAPGAAFQIATLLVALLAALHARPRRVNLGASLLCCKLLGAEPIDQRGRPPLPCFDIRHRVVALNDLHGHADNAGPRVAQEEAFCVKHTLLVVSNR